MNFTTTLFSGIKHPETQEFNYLAATDEEFVYTIEQIGTIVPTIKIKDSAAEQMTCSDNHCTYTYAIASFKEDKIVAEITSTNDEQDKYSVSTTTTTTPRGKCN